MSSLGRQVASELERCADRKDRRAPALCLFLAVACRFSRFSGRFSGKVQWQGSVAGWVQWQGSVAGFSGRVQWLGVRECIMAAAGPNIKLVVQRCDAAKLLVDNDKEWVSMGCGLVVFVSFCKVCFLAIKKCRDCRCRCVTLPHIMPAPAVHRLQMPSKAPSRMTLPLAVGYHVMMGTPTCLGVSTANTRAMCNVGVNMLMSVSGEAKPGESIFWRLVGH